MNIALPEADVVGACTKLAIRISAIETLPSGGTHLVCLTSEGAEQARGKFAKSLIAGRVKRFPFMGAGLRAS